VFRDDGVPDPLGIEIVPGVPYPICGHGLDEPWSGMAVMLGECPFDAVDGPAVREQVQAINGKVNQPHQLTALNLAAVLCGIVGGGPFPGG